MSIIIDLNASCLVCLQDTKDLRSIFEFDEQTHITIAEKITLCSELQTPRMENSKLPDKICERCINDLCVVWTFLQNCKTANSLFHSIMQEEEAEVMAGLELEQQKIKLPTGLKIKRIQPETNTYLMPVEFEEDGLSDDMDDVEEHIAISTQEETDTALQGEHEITDDQIGLLMEDAAVVEDEEEEEEFDEEVLEDEFYDGEHEFQEESCSIEEYDSAEEYIKETKEVDLVIKEKKAIKVEPGAQKQGRSRHKIPEDEEYLPESERSCSSIKEESKIDEQIEYPATKNTKNSNRKQTEKTGSNNNNTSKGTKSKDSLVPRKTKGRSGSVRPQKICEICGNTYKYQHALNAHMRRHTNTRPFPCEFCDKAFISNVELRRHLRVHTGQKPYPCQYCDRRFSDFGSRIKHERSHTGERPYVCYCGKSFAYPHVLSVHLRTHTGEKKFQCTQCNKGFTKKAYLQAHLEQHTRVANANSAGISPTKGKRDSSRSEMEALKPAVSLEQCIFTSEYAVDSDVDDTKALNTDADDTTHKQRLKDDEFILGMS